MPGSKLWRDCQSSLALIGFGALLVAGAPQGWSQTPTTATAATPAAPAVQDEPNQPIPPRIQTPQASATALTPQTTAQRLDAFNSLAQAREEVRRAFIKQDYERVLALSRDLQLQFSVDESQNFYLVAAQLRLSERKDREEGRRSFEKLSDRAPVLTLDTQDMPTVEASLNQTPPAQVIGGSPGATPPATETATEAQPGISTEDIVIAAGPTALPGGGEPISDPTAAVPTTLPGEGALIPVAADPTPAVEQPAATPEATETPGEFTIATAMTPMPATPEPVLPAPAAATPYAGQNFIIALIVCGLIGLIIVFVIARRRREEPEESLATTLGGLRLDAEENETMTAPVERTAVAPAAARPRTGTTGLEVTELDESALGEEPTGKVEAENETAPATPEEDFANMIFGAKDEPKTAEQNLSVLEPQATMRLEPKEDLIQIEGFEEENTKTQARQTERAEPEGNPFAEATGATISLDNLPDTPIDGPTWQPNGDSISLDMNGEPPTAATKEPPTPSMEQSVSLDESLPAFEAPFQRSESSPELDETSAPTEARSGGPTETTRTSWQDIGNEATSELPRGTEPGFDLPSVEIDEDRLKAFHLDETIDLREEEEQDPESTQVSQAIAGLESRSESGASESTIASPRAIETGEPSAGEDLFDREYRTGMECFHRQDWGGAVHHLSVAAALRPDQSEVKEKLREARRSRKI